MRKTEYMMALEHRSVTVTDPYPFIFLNLILSCLTAMQAPVIMMSQNRHAAKDRLRSQQDYKINLKAELEIRSLHEKIDHLLSHQWEKMVKIQGIQLKMLLELDNLKKDSTPSAYIPQDELAQ